MKTILLAVAIFIAVPTFAQNAPDHAILPEQCRADGRLWHSQTKDDTIKLSFDELQQRGAEMWNCIAIDTGTTGESLEDQKTNFENYKDLFMLYGNLRLKRTMAFITRHDLLTQFNKEDAAGVR